MKENRKAWCWLPSLYIAEGLPYVIVATVANTIYKRMGMPNAELALYTSLLGLPAIIKPLWSPFVDIFRTRRQWIIAMQLLLVAGFAAVAFSLPSAGWVKASFASFMAVAFFSSTHDIAADGFYIIALNEKDQSFFAGIRVTIYRLSMLLGQGPLVILAGYLETAYGDIPRAWATVFYILAAAMALIAVYDMFVLPRPAADHRHTDLTPARVWRDFIDTFRDFFTKDAIVVSIVFMLLYKLPEAQLTRMIQPFLLDPKSAGGLALSTAQVGLVYGTVGLAGMLAGGITGGIVASRDGLRRWMMPMAWSMSLTCITFVWLSFVPSPSMFEIYAGVLIEQFGYGFGTTAYMLYLLHFSRGSRASANYAICTGFMAIGSMIPGSSAGIIQQWVGYGNFFLIAMAGCAATIIVAWMARKHI